MIYWSLAAAAAAAATRCLIFGLSGKLVDIERGLTASKHRARRIVSAFD